MPSVIIIAERLLDPSFRRLVASLRRRLRPHAESATVDGASARVRPSPEALIRKGRHRDQDLAVEIEALATPFLHAPGHRGMLGIVTEFSTREPVRSVKRAQGAAEGAVISPIPGRRQLKNGKARGRHWDPRPDPSGHLCALDLFSVTAARMRALSASSSIVSPSRKSMARLVLPSRLELKRRDGSFKAAPLAKVIFTTFL